MPSKTFKVEISIPGYRDGTVVVNDRGPFGKRLLSQYPAVALEKLTIEWGRSEYFTRPKRRVMQCRLAISTFEQWEEFRSVVFRTGIYVRVNNHVLFAGIIQAIDAEIANRHDFAVFVDMECVEVYPYFRPGEGKREAWWISTPQRNKPNLDPDAAAMISLEKWTNYLVNTALVHTGNLAIQWPRMIETGDNIGNNSNGVSLYVNWENDAATIKRYTDNPAPGLYMQMAPDNSAMFPTLRSLRDIQRTPQVPIDCATVEIDRNISATNEEWPGKFTWTYPQWRWVGTIDKDIPGSVIGANRVREFETELILRPEVSKPWANWLGHVLKVAKIRHPKITIDSEKPEHDEMFRTRPGGSYAALPGGLSRGAPPIGLRTFEWSQSFRASGSLYTSGRPVDLLPIGGRLTIYPVEAPETFDKVNVYCGIRHEFDVIPIKIDSIPQFGLGVYS